MSRVDPHDESMGCQRQPLCGEATRREALRAAGHLNGIDFVDVGDDGVTLCVHLFGAIPDGIGPRNVRIDGGDRITGLRAVSVDIDDNPDMHDDACLRIVLDREGDHSPYCLCLIDAPDDDAPDPGPARPYPGFDPRHACAGLRFRLGCGRTGDCQHDIHCEQSPEPTPEIDYLAKDYESFRRLFLDRMAQTMPQWSERHVPDLGIALVEVLAYTADHLSYYQDAVATEAYLETARKRISVRRHARLVDYHMHEGCNARAWLVIDADDDVALPLADLLFLAPPSQARNVSPGVLDARALDDARAAGAVMYEPLPLAGETEVQVRAAHRRIAFHTWGDTLCCLPRGSTRATLRDPGTDDNESAGDVPARTLRLRAGDLLVFEEVLGTRTGAPADADPGKRHAVRLTSVRESVDRLDGTLLLEIQWHAADALPFDLCLSVRLPAPDCAVIGDVSVARGNVLLVDHGEHVDHLRCDCSALCDPNADLSRYPGLSAARDALGRGDDDAPTPCEACSALHEDCWFVPGEADYGCCHCENAVVDAVRNATRVEHTLPVSPLTWAEPVSADASAQRLFERDPREALPQLRVHGGALEDVLIPAHPAPQWRWHARPDLLASDPDERHFVVEVDDEGAPHLRFGDGVLGRAPQAGDFFRAAPRVGNGPAGNVGRDSIVWMAFKADPVDGVALRPRNPMPARGGTAPEPMAQVKRFAPGTFRAQPQRAIVAEDYAAFAAGVPGVQGAACTMEWTGSWYEANVAVDALGRETLARALDASVEAQLERYRRIGHDLAAEAACYVPLAIELRVCVHPDYLRADIDKALRDCFTAGLRRDGQPGFFHPDRLRLGASVYASVLVAQAQGITGVQHVEVLTLARQEHFTTGDVPDDGVLRMAGREVAQVANDADHPDHGYIDFSVGGGR